MSTLQSTDQYRQATWVYDLDEKNYVLTQEWIERGETQKARRSYQRKSCANCGQKFSVSHPKAKYCSHSCYGQKARTIKNAIPCMLCLQSLGFGLKAIARQTGKHHATIRTVLIRGGHYLPSGDSKRAANREVLSNKTNRTGHIGTTARIAKRRANIAPLLTPIQKTRRMLRHQIIRLIQMMKCNRQFRTEEYVGCSFDDARKAIEGKFVDGMSWDNYGTEWEIDHIQPMSSFDLSDPNQVMMVNHISNLQPMNPSLNRSKGNKIIPKKITRLLG